MVLPDRHFECATDAGCLRHPAGPGDPAAAANRPASPACGELLDLGTVFGPIALAMASFVPDATVRAVDINERALNSRGAGDAGAAAWAGQRAPRGGGRPQLPGQLAAIWSDPLIRVGKQALHGMLARWGWPAGGRWAGPPRGPAEPGLGIDCSVPGRRPRGGWLPGSCLRERLTGAPQAQLAMS